MVTGPGRGSSSWCAVAGTVTAAVTSDAAAARPARIRARRASAEVRGALESIRGFHRLGAQLHVMRAAELLLVEVDLEGGYQLLAVPAEAPHELLVVGAGLVPVREERGGDVDAGAVPALRDHVDLLAGDALVGLLRLLGIRQVEVAGLAVHERVDPEAGAVLVDADVHRQGDLGRVADDADFLRLPLAGGVGLDEPELRGERRGGDRPAVTVLERPADLERRARNAQDLPGLHR